MALFLLLVYECIVIYFIETYFLFIQNELLRITVTDIFIIMLEDGYICPHSGYLVLLSSLDPPLQLEEKNQ